ncbi:hypothetical protein [Acuticoccus mangrovi]|uniref:Nitrate reductase n=1 Tax=Acuticoccus mangrovi TaxID=2796142 RepID=A0A934MHU8_9HYPH|nr:hypothetical protein [Acuticoccus mangrovi]MBJ3778063.1 hypothetical protein [Acuticoccus mangrovi]
MLGLFKRQRPDVEAVRRVKALVAARFDVADQAAITVAELRCAEPGCPPVETVITVREADGRLRQWRIAKPIAEVEGAEVAGLGAES